MDRRTIWDQLERKDDEKPKRAATRATPKRSFIKQW
jgi:hypothetical protein